LKQTSGVSIQLLHGMNKRTGMSKYGCTPGVWYCTSTFFQYTRSCLLLWYTNQ